MCNSRNNLENAENKWYVGEGPGNCPYNSWVAAGSESLAVLWWKTWGRSIHSMPRLCRQGCRDNAQPWTYVTRHIRNESCARNTLSMHVELINGILKPS